MRKVFSTTADVCNVWAAREQDEARTGSNTSFRGDILRSYGTPIARIVALAGDAGFAALVSSNRWSSGTSKVQGEARAAAFVAGMAVYEVPNLCLCDDVAAVRANLEHYEARIGEALEAIRKAVRWDTARGHRATALQIIATASLYASDMGEHWHWTGENPLAVRNDKETF